MLNVFITTDVEIWPDSWDQLGPRDFREVFRRYIYGPTPRGDYGLPFQLRLLREHGLKGTFFVEPLFAEYFGNAALAEIVDLIRDGGQEVQLHMHTEWVDKSSTPILPERAGRHLHHFDEDEQSTLIGIGLENLHDCGVSDVCAFRAGNYGADVRTLRALRRHGIRYDSSYNYPYLGNTCDLQRQEPLYQPQGWEGLCELPINFFEDYPGHFRHTQITACSFGELSSMMSQAERRGWFSFVLVSHSFEFMNAAKTRANPVVVRRFEKLCRFLAEHPERFRTRFFGELEETEIPTVLPRVPLRSRLWRTAWRYGEQALSRLLYE